MVDRSCFPQSKIWLRQILPGSLFALVGVVIYCALETDVNYYYTHSLWHVLMALAIIFLLPRTEKLEWRSILDFFQNFKDIKRRQTIEDAIDIDNSATLIVARAESDDRSADATSSSSTSQARPVK